MPVTYGWLTDIVLNAAMVVSTFFCVRHSYYETGTFSLRGRGTWKFFTTLSNVLNAAGALIMMIFLIVCVCQGKTKVPYAVWVLKYLGTASVTVTFFTVVLFLVRYDGPKAMFGGTGLYLHTLGPIASIVSFCFLERYYTMTFARSFLGLIPTVIYGLVYMKKVVFQGKENGGWSDFYHFTQAGKWQLSMAAMYAGAFVVCLILLGLCHIEG